MSQLGDLLDQLEQYEFVDAKNDPLVESQAFVELRKIAADMDRVLAEPKVVTREEKDRLLAQLGTPLPHRGNTPPADPDPTPWNKATVVLSTVQIHGVPYPVTIAWDTCYRCNLHIKLCKCAKGPTEPPSVSSWRPENVKQDITKPAPVADSTLVMLDLPGDDTEDTRQAPVWQGAAVKPSKRGRHHETVVELPPLGEESEAALPKSEAVTLSEGVCKSCGKSVTTEDADPNDDGTWTCFVCQAQEG